MNVPTPLIIGLTGKARSGKDSAAHALSTLGYRHLAFADPLKLALSSLTSESIACYHLDDLKEAQCPALGISRRSALQGFGTAIREAFGSDVFVRLLLAKIEAKPSANVVISDVRYPHEAQALRELGGVIIHIRRPGHAGLEGAESLHDSEHGLPPTLVDDVLVNDGSLEDLHDKVSRMAAYWGAYSRGAE